MSHKENKLKCLTNDEIDEKMDNIERSCSRWKSSHDGSYEMALDSKGYTELHLERKRRENL